MPGANSWLGSKNSNCRAFEGNASFFCCRVDETLVVSQTFSILYSVTISLNFVLIAIEEKTKQNKNRVLVLADWLRV